jgi:hypothetical protein
LFLVGRDGGGEGRVEMVEKQFGWFRFFVAGSTGCVWWGRTTMEGISAKEGCWSRLDLGVGLTAAPPWGPPFVWPPPCSFAHWTNVPTPWPVGNTTNTRQTRRVWGSAVSQLQIQPPETKSLGSCALQAQHFGSRQPPWSKC